MTGDEKIRRANRQMAEALGCLHAAGDVAERALAEARGGRPHRRGRAWPLAAAVAAGLAAVLATGGVAYAVVTSDFFQAAWGDHGLGDEVSWSMETDAGTTYHFTRELGSPDPAIVSEDLSAAVEDVGLTVSGNGYTLTVERMVVDENGCGVVTFTLENPAGINNASDTDGWGMAGATGALWFPDGAGLDSLSMDCADGSTPNCRSLYDVSTSTATEVHGTFYFDAWGNPDAVLGGVSWRLNWHTGELAEIVHAAASTDVFTPTAVVAARELSDGAGNVAHLSPMSLSFSLADYQAEEFSGDSVTIQLADGTERVVAGEGTVNSYTQTLSGLGEHNTYSYTLTQLVDTSQVVSVTIAGEGARYVLTPVA